MKNRNNVVLTIIAIATILVTVIGATFAYFASTVDEGNPSNFTAIIDEDNVLFTATGSNMTMDITADKMTQHASSGGVITAGSASDSTMNVTLTTGTEGSIACSYNIYFQWESSANAYLTKTTGATNEFTAQLSLSDSNGTGSSGTNKFASETQLTDVVTTINRTLVVEGASIVANASQSGSQTWTPTVKFYNLQLDQTALAGKSYKGTFTIDDVECGAYQQSLSESIIAKVSEDDYTSSQDGSIYKVTNETATRENYDTYKLVPKTKYTNVTYYSSTTYNATSGTDASEVFEQNNEGTWSNNASNMNAGDNYFTAITLPEDKYYRICYSIEDGDDDWAYDSFFVMFNGNSIFYRQGSKSRECIELGHYNSGDKIVVRYKASEEIGSYTFELYSTATEEELDAGVRYEGADPDNYVTFNGETWRIIGAFEGSTIGLNEGKYYTKIINNVSYGSLSWSDTFGNDYYKSLNKPEMVANALWYRNQIAGSDFNYYGISGKSIGDAQYLSERYKNNFNWAAAPVYLNVFMVSPSDIYYSVYNSACDNNIITEDNMYDLDCRYASWLYNLMLSPWTNIESAPLPYYTDMYYDNNTAYYLHDYGLVMSTDKSNTYNNIYPTLYLESDVYVTGGSGTKLDPYVLN